MNALSFVLNGRFLQRKVTGVERLAIELSRALRLLLETTGTNATFDVAIPRGVKVDPSSLTANGLPSLATHIVGRHNGHLWEQTELVRYGPAAWLLNLCNSAPIIRRRQAVIICDAQFILHPESYALFYRWWYRMMLFVVGRRAAAIFTISEFSKGQLEHFGLVPQGKAHVLRLGVDHLQAVEADPAILDRCELKVRPYILATGSLARHKNLSTLINAFLSAEFMDVDLIIAGGGNDRVFASAGLAGGDNVRFLGRVSDGELRALYGNAMAFACPSLSEGFGFTPLEAMTTGCPVLATSGGAVPEVCGDAALYADPLDTAQWRDGLIRMVNDAALRADLGARGLARSQTYRWSETARQMLLVLAEQDKMHDLVQQLQPDL